MLIISDRNRYRPRFPAMWSALPVEFDPQADPDGPPEELQVPFEIGSLAKYTLVKVSAK